MLRLCAEAASLRSWLKASTRYVVGSTSETVVMTDGSMLKGRNSPLKKSNTGISRPNSPLATSALRRRAAIR